MAAETLRAYTATWLENIRPTVRHTTVRAYEQTLRCRAFPTLGDTPIDEITRPQLKVWFAWLLARYKPGTAGHALVTLHTLLACAVEDEVLVKNPASSLRRAMRAVLRDKRAAERPPMTRDQLVAFLSAAQEAPETYPAVLLMAFTGVRIGEAIGLQWEDVDFLAKAVRIRRQVYADGSVGDLKSGAGLRSIDLADRLAETLLALRRDRLAHEARFRVPSSPWVLFPDLGPGCTCNMARKVLERAVKGALSRASLPSHFSCHSLRHTIATALVEQGANLKYVQRLLGHASITITADRYARSARMTDTATVERFSAALLTEGRKDA